MKRSRRELVGRALRWCAVGFAIAAVASGVASLTSGDVGVSGSLIVAAVAFGLAVYACIAALGFMEVHGRLRKRDHPIA